MSEYGICPECGRQQSLRPDGQLVRHHDTKSGPYGSYVVRCKGSGQQPTASEESPR